MRIDLAALNAQYREWFVLGVEVACEAFRVRGRGARERELVVRQCAITFPRNGIRDLAGDVVVTDDRRGSRCPLPQRLRCPQSGRRIADARAARLPRMEQEAIAAKNVESALQK
ncbi:hypothetical protein GCM10027360_41300 [Amycolatopsis echigonensis]